MNALMFASALVASVSGVIASAIAAFSARRQYRREVEPARKVMVTFRFENRIQTLLLANPVDWRKVFESINLNDGELEEIIVREIDSGGAAARSLQHEVRTWGVTWSDRDDKAQFDTKAEAIEHARIRIAEHGGEVRIHNLTEEGPDR